MSHNHTLKYVEWKRNGVLFHQAGFVTKETSKTLCLASTLWGNQYLDPIHIPKTLIVRTITLNYPEQQGV